MLPGQSNVAVLRSQDLGNAQVLEVRVHHAHTASVLQEMGLWSD